MTSNQRNWTVLIVTISVIGLPVYAYIQDSARTEEDIVLMLRVTALTSFMLYLLVFVARPLRQLFATPLTQTMLGNRRYYGIAFAGSHTVHLALIVAFVLDANPSPQIVVLGGIAYVLLFSMLITSFDAPATAIGSTAWRRLHKTGLYWNGGIFAAVLLPKVIGDPGNLTYLAAAVLVMSAIGVRVLAFVKGRQQSN
ncbi:MAG: hypothetical protein ACE5OQ_04225 [Woeseia sp.]